MQFILSGGLQLNMQFVHNVYYHCLQLFMPSTHQWYKLCQQVVLVYVNNMQHFAEKLWEIWKTQLSLQRLLVAFILSWRTRQVRTWLSRKGWLCETFSLFFVHSCFHDVIDKCHFIGCTLKVTDKQGQSWNWPIFEHRWKITAAFLIGKKDKQK